MVFHKFTDSQLLRAFVYSHCPQFSDKQVLQVEELSDGNINYIYRVGDGRQSVIVKQALPYIRIIGESWPLSQQRIRIEANGLRHAAKHCRNRVPELYHYDEHQHALIMEDLQRYQNLREALLSQRPLAHLVEHMAEFMACTHFFSSDFYLNTEQKSALISESLNPDLCNSTETVFFGDPWCDHERNNVQPGLDELVAKQWGNLRLKQRVAELKYRFRSNAQVLLHGDLHTGSVFVTDEDSRVIDPEFGFVGPAGFDLGVLVANLLLNACVQRKRGDEGVRYAERLILQVTELCQQYSARFLRLGQSDGRDTVLLLDSHMRQWLKQVMVDALGFAGTEMVRRTIGIAQVAEWEALTPDESRLAARKSALLLGQKLILKAEQIDDLSASLFSFFENR